MPLINASNLSDFIAMNDLHFVRGSKNLYWYFDQDAKTWKPVSKTGVEQLPVIAESKNPKERTLVDFYDIMKRQNREIDGVYRGLDERNGLLNLFVRGSWLKPIIDQTHEAHPIFDILMTSLAGGRQEVKDRIEQCLLHKIFFPEEIAVPTLVMYGQGGVGKGLFYNVCHAIFGKNTVSVEHSRIFTDRNSIIEGKVIIYLDDFQANQKETDDIKKIVYNREFVTRAEYNAAVTNQNMTWWFISHNYADRPPVILQGDISEGADRRWFVVKHKDGQTLHYWISQSPDYKLYRDSGRFKTTVEYFSDRKPILDDDVAISHWLGSLVVKRESSVEIHCSLTRFGSRNAQKKALVAT